MLGFSAVTTGGLSSIAVGCPPESDGPWITLAESLPAPNWTSIDKVVSEFHPDKAVRPVSRPDWASLEAKEYLERFGSVQDSLDHLAEKHLNKRVHNKDIVRDITSITHEAVYCCREGGVVVRKWGFNFPTVYYKTREGLLEIYPVLQKYSHWQRLFEQEGDSNCYLLRRELVDWLVTRDAEYKVEESIW